MVLFQTTSCAATATSSTVAEGPAAPARAMHPPSRSLAALLPATALALLAFLPATTAFVVPGWPGRKAAPLGEPHEETASLLSSGGGVRERVRR